MRFAVSEKPQIERDLVVATARGVQFSSGGADPFCEGGFDVHVHIFERFVPLKFSIFDLPLDRPQSIVDLVAFVGRNNAGGGKRGGMRDRSGDVVRIKPPIE